MHAMAKVRHNAKVTWAPLQHRQCHAVPGLGAHDESLESRDADMTNARSRKKDPKNSAGLVMLGEHARELHNE